MDASSLLLAIIGHLVGDYLLQNDWMSLNKKTRSFPCAVHCALWALSVWVFSGWTAWTLPILFVLHFAQDRTGVIMWWMTRVNSQKAFATGPCAPWSIIVVDNVWHIVSLWAIWRFVV